MREVWKNINGYENIYEVSNLGRIRSLYINRRILKITKLKNGYLTVTLTKNRKRQCLYIHSLVLKHFLSDRPAGMDSCHNDGNKENNIISNLRWDTKKNNQQDRFKHGSMRVGERHQNSKLDNRDVLFIREFFKKFPKNTKNMREIAEQLGVCRTTIHLVVYKKIWKHL